MSKKILVLENTEGISELLHISLPSDYDVLSASNGKEALEIISQSNPPLLVFDIKVPDMDGIEFLCKVKKQSPHTEIITIVDQDKMDLGITSLKYEASDYITKPVTSKSLEVALERAEEKLAIKKRLSPTTGEVFPSLIQTERESLAKQFIDIISANSSKIEAKDTGYASGIISIHTRNGMILKTSDGYKALLGQMEGKKSWEIYKKGSVKPESCPAAQAFKTKSPYIEDMILSTKDGKEIKARIHAAPLVNYQDQVDLVVVIITL